VDPELIVHDLHPDYLSTRYALNRQELEGLELLGIQHHHAHIAACLADNHYQADEPVIGMAFDGIGFGDDGAIWGGEILIADYLTYNRIGHLEYFPLPGGDKAIREPWRIALALLHKYEIPWDPTIPPLDFANSIEEPIQGVQAAEILMKQLISKTNTPSTSSLGRLFDGVASLIGLRHQITYEGQAAIELEAIVNPDERGDYPLKITDDLLLSPVLILKNILADYHRGVDSGVISARFHNTLSNYVVEAATVIRSSQHLDTVALSGGVWQNMSLLKESTRKLRKAGFQVLLHQQVPTNDGGISFGQAVIGQKHLQV
jgi:hydrogenase maturation protein HypF